MKLAIILTLTLFSILPAWGQSTGNCPRFNRANICGENEIGINGYNITDLKRKYVNCKLTSGQNYGNGIMYKYHCRKNTFRIGLTYYYSKFVYEDIGRSYHYREAGENKIGELNVGYERNLVIGTFQPFVAMDLSLLYGKVTGIIGGVGDWYYWNTEHPYDVTIQEVGVVPTFGFKFRPFNRISISAETNIRIAYSDQKDLLDSKQDVSEGRIYVNPLRVLSLNYHF